MGYLDDITREIGDNQDIIFVGTGVILLDDEDRIFMARRTDNDQWSIPGGSLELGESLEECAVRETLEETNIRVRTEDLTLNSVKSIPEPIDKNGKTIFVVSTSYWTRVYNCKSLMLDKREFKGCKWVSVRDIGKIEKITPYTKVAIEEYKKNNKLFMMYEKAIY